MGLDMYLTADRYLWYNEDDTKNAITQLLPELPAGAVVQKVGVEVGYWRKANAIHKWFVDNLQDGRDDCQRTEVHREDLQILADLCQKVIDNPSEASKLLPTRSGFFFGSTEYDDGYFDDLKRTVDICRGALSLPDKWDLHYSSSW